MQWCVLESASIGRLLFLAAAGLEALLVLEDAAVFFCLPSGVPRISGTGPADEAPWYDPMPSAWLAGATKYGVRLTEKFCLTVPETLRHETTLPLAANRPPYQQRGG